MKLNEIVDSTRETIESAVYGESQDSQEYQQDPADYDEISELGPEAFEQMDKVPDYGKELARDSYQEAQENTSPEHFEFLDQVEEDYESPEIKRDDGDYIVDFGFSEQDGSLKACRYSSEELDVVSNEESYNSVGRLLAGLAPEMKIQGDDEIIAEYDSAIEEATNYLQGQEGIFDANETLVEGVVNVLNHEGVIDIENDNLGNDKIILDSGMPNTYKAAMEHGLVERAAEVSGRLGKDLKQIGEIGEEVIGNEDSLAADIEKAEELEDYFKDKDESLSHSEIAGLQTDSSYFDPQALEAIEFIDTKDGSRGHKDPRGLGYTRRSTERMLS